MQTVKNWDHSLVFCLKSSRFGLIKKLFSAKKIGLKMESVSTPKKRKATMTKTKTYKYGPHTFKSYFKPVGNGWEVGFTHGNRTYWVGNFVHKAEATKWWGMFNKEIMTFSKRFNFTQQMPFSWYCNFLSNHMYTCYYTWLDKMFNKHETTFKKAYSKDFKRYMKMKKTGTTTTTTKQTGYFLKAV